MSEEGCRGCGGSGAASLGWPFCLMMYRWPWFELAVGLMEGIPPPPGRVPATRQVDLAPTPLFLPSTDIHCYDDSTSPASPTCADLKVSPEVTVTRQPVRL